MNDHDEYDPVYEHELYVMERNDHQAHVWAYHTEQHINGK